MGRRFPTYLLSIADDVKNPGIFVTRTIDPVYVAKIHDFGKLKSQIKIEFIEFFNEDFLETIEPENQSKTIKFIHKHLINWYYNERKKVNNITYQSKEVLRLRIEQFSFMENQIPFTVEEARQLIRIAFPNKLKTINKNHSSYGLKHLLERISRRFGQGKYCSNDTLKEAFLLEGFKSEEASTLNLWFNISERDYDLIENTTPNKDVNLPFDIY